MIPRSFRSRVTAIGVLTLAFVLSGASWATVKALEAGARSDITDQNNDVLGVVAEQIFAGTAPELVPLPIAQDGTEFVVLNSADQPVNFSVAFVDAGVALSEEELAELVRRAELGSTSESFAAEAYELPAFEIDQFGEPASMLSPENFVRTSQEVTSPTGDVFTLTAATPLETVTRGMRRVVTGLVIAVPVLVILSGFLLWVALGAALRPVQRISEEASRIAPSNSGRRLPVPDSGDEIATMTQTLNDMLDRLDNGLIRQNSSCLTLLTSCVHL